MRVAFLLINYARYCWVSCLAHLNLFFRLLKSTVENSCFKASALWKSKLLYTIPTIEQGFTSLINYKLDFAKLGRSIFVIKNMGTSGIQAFLTVAMHDASWVGHNPRLRG